VRLTFHADPPLKLHHNFVYVIIEVSVSVIEAVAEVNVFCTRCNTLQINCTKTQPDTGKETEETFKVSACIFRSIHGVALYNPVHQTFPAAALTAIDDDSPGNLWT
jgi:hypothetical protein